ncbi:hypothetical protein D1007_54019 [Hordeum vulgare]|nr:hypothetical protein D1007_54019 [Hordeum vulgare]
MSFSPFFLTMLFLLALLSSRHHAAVSQGSSGYRGIRARPFDAFYVEIHFGEMRLSLDTEMNFPEVTMQELAPPPQLVTDEGRREKRRREHHLGVTEMDEEAMAVWRQRFPEDVINKREFYAERRAE